MDDYFRRRSVERAPDYEESYWGVVVDPDGNVRDRLQERSKYLADVRQELEYLNGLSGGRLVDVGCGLGYLLSGLDERWEKYGVEVSAFAAERAREWGRIHCGTLQDASYPNEFFDAVVLHHVIEHVADPVSLIDEVRRILRPQGGLVLGTPDFDSACARRFGSKYRLLHDKTHISLFTNDSMHRFLREHGFVIDCVEYPYFDTRYFTAENLMRLFDTEKISPPFYGNFMTFYCRNPSHSPAADTLARLGQSLHRMSERRREEIEQAAGLLRVACRITLLGLPPGGGMDLERRLKTITANSGNGRDSTVTVTLRQSSLGVPAALEFRPGGNTVAQVVITLDGVTPEEETNASILVLDALAASAERQSV